MAGTVTIWGRWLWQQPHGGQVYACKISLQCAACDMVTTPGESTGEQEERHKHQVGGRTCTAGRMRVSSSSLIIWTTCARGGGGGSTGLVKILSARVPQEGHSYEPCSQL